MAFGPHPDVRCKGRAAFRIVAAVRRSVGRPFVIDQEAGARDQRACVGSEKQGGAHQVLHLSQPALGGSDRRYMFLCLRICVTLGKICKSRSISGIVSRTSGLDVFSSDAGMPGLFAAEPRISVKTNSAS